MERVFAAGRPYVARVVVLVVLGLVLGLVTTSGARAATSTSVNIAPKAYVSEVGFRLDTELTIQCTGGAGSVTVTVTQTPAQSSSGVGASGTNFAGFPPAKCDGSPHKLAVTVLPLFGGFYNVGKASASATLAAPSGTVSDARTIQIIVK
jgi:hypothetical protein